MRNIIFIILGFFVITGLTIYFQGRITVKYMIKAVDAKGKIYKEYEKELIHGSSIHKIKSLKKNIISCKLARVVNVFLISNILIIIEVILESKNIYGIKVYTILERVYELYFILRCLSNEYKHTITLNYIAIFNAIETLKGKYNNNIYKIPFVDKLEIYNSTKY